MIKKLSLFSLLFLSLFFFTKQSTFAQETTGGIDMTVSPSLFEFTNVPGSKIQSQFRIRNNLMQPMPLQISLGKLVPNGESLQPTDVSDSDDFQHWITFDQASISARPKEWTQVKFTIATPKTAAFGYYYVIRIKQILPQQLQKNVQEKVTSEVLIPILLEIKSDGANAQAAIVDFKPKSFINEYLPVDFITTIKNTGNMHIKPTGNIFIHTGSEKDMAVLDVNAGLGTILPGGGRTFISSWNDGFLVQEPVIEDGQIKLDKNKQPVTHLVINWNNLTHFRLGKYTANILMVYDNGKRDVPIEASTTFWVIPYTMIGIAIGAIIILILLIRFMIKLAIKQEMKKYKNNI